MAIEKKTPRETGSAKRHIMIENVSPTVDCGRFPCKRVVGDEVVVEADIFRDGHEVIRSSVKWRRLAETNFSEAPVVFFDNDRWRGKFTVTENDRYVFLVEAWTDRFASWLADFRKRVVSGMEVSSELTEGLSLLSRIAAAARGRDAQAVKTSIDNLNDSEITPEAALQIVSAPALNEIVDKLQERADVVQSPVYNVIVDRKRALFGAWYEFFVRSQGDSGEKSGTFRDAERRLPEIRGMGFNVLYLPPIHPIGRTARKGPNNSLKAEPTDPGSPWAIGNERGGHTAIEPSLGTIEDFDRFVAAARKLGMEIALDFAIQCSPDHPWVKEHPEWFYHRPDGTIKYAENPPKKYEDIYPLNFDSDHAEDLWNELKSVLLYWISHGVKIFRVDNPHTKPIAFWEWVIREIQSEHPEVIFLAEAFTRPKVMKALAKAGFTQSYTYFTWRNDKLELTEYLTELSTSDMREYFRPNFFANTPDILHEFLQHGGRPAFKIRLILAATMSPTFGIYSGFELCENQAVPGTEEYLDTEKFQIKPRDWNAPGNIKYMVKALNELREESPCLQRVIGIRFLDTDNGKIIAYMKATEDKKNVVIVVLNLDPVNTQSGHVRVPLDKAGVPWGSNFQVLDVLTGRRFSWGEHNFVILNPHDEPGHVLLVEKATV